MRLSLLTLITLFVVSCTEKEVTTDEGSLIGKWQLAEYYISPGDFNVTWTAADPANPSYVEFTMAGRMIFSGSNQPERVYDYEILEDGLLSTRNDNVNVKYGYEFENQRLILSGGGCIEACLYKYKRVSTPNVRGY